MCSYTGHGDEALLPTFGCMIVILTDRSEQYRIGEICRLSETLHFTNLHALTSRNMPKAIYLNTKCYKVSACYHSVQNLLSSRLLSKNLKIKIYRTVILPVVFYAKLGR